MSDVLPLPGFAPDSPGARVIEIGNVPVRIEVVRSVRRHRTVAARPVGGVLRVSIPASMSVRQEERWVREMARRHVRTRRLRKPGHDRSHNLPAADSAVLVVLGWMYA